MIAKVIVLSGKNKKKLQEYGYCAISLQLLYIFLTYVKLSFGYSCFKSTLRWSSSNCF